ncbi:prepilin peptidase [Polaribacter glomeratus]|nr:prepilin peptidase [Polaribacter glomeratus]TXD64162.1 hypothetical protein ESX12_15740 [Polaribacter glomeratus]
MRLIIELLLILILGILFYQDIKERKVSVWVLILGLGLGGFLNYQAQQPIVFLSNSLVNIIFIILIFLVLWLYAKLKMKKNIFEVFGKGDLLFFILLAVSLPILSFLMVFIFSIFFSFLVFSLLKHRFKDTTVPLAGLQSLFLALVLMVNKIVPSINIYAL